MRRRVAKGVFAKMSGQTENHAAVIPVIVVAGPTACGKSALAMEIAERHGGEIVNADSMQVYRELRVLTARPDPADEARVAHHLYGVQSVAETCSAGAWLEMAVPVIADVAARGRLPIVCGGTGLYLKVLMEGIAPVPDVPRAEVAAAESLFDEIGGTAFVERLRLVDPAAAEALNSGDRQRLVRAYSVAQATGRTLAAWQTEQPAGPAINARFLRVVLKPERDQLYARIEARFDAMIAARALDEVAALVPLNLDPALPALKALGVPEFMRHLTGESDLDAAVERAKQLTRNFAKRQMTWFRGQMAADVTVLRFGAAGYDGTASALEDFLKLQRP